MGLCLIAAATDTSALILSILQIAVGLGLVIFVHELGHFAVAKWCGVRCDKFYLGFDIYGLKLAKFRWGETEYGIGILPLGGYVKMLGQEDNPARVAEEIERAKSTGVIQKDGEMTSLLGVAPDGTPIYDPRSYLAKSVPQRMAIISAGVIMNVIFAFVLALLAFRMGVDLTPAVAGGTAPGGPAWAANIQPGDKILRVGDVDHPLYRDIINGVVLGDVNTGVTFLVERHGTGQVESINLKPIRGGHLPQIGLLSQASLTVARRDAEVMALSPWPKAEPPLERGDVIRAIQGRPVESMADVARALAEHPDETLTLTVARSPVGAADNDRTLGNIVRGWFSGQAADDASKDQSIEVTLPPRPMLGLGLVMEMNALSAIQVDSPAAAAGLQPGDVLLAIDGQPPGDPLTLPNRLRQRAGQQVTLKVQRPGEAEPRLFENITLRPTTELFTSAASLLTTQPVAVPALGIAYTVSNRIAAVEPESPAAKAGLAAGMTLESATFKLTEAAKKSELFRAPSLALGGDRLLYPALIDYIQVLPEGTEVILTNNDNKEFTLLPVTVPGWFNPDRDLPMKELLTPVVATTWGQAFRLAGAETKGALLQVYGFLRKLGHQIDVRMLGGPLTIFKQAKYTAERSLTDYMLFLTLLSANLAVVNFLPIPILDGGHMVFLALEWIRGKPVGEKVIVAFHYAGFLFIVSLMLFVLGLDLGLIPRGL